VDTLGGLMATIVFVHAHPDDEASSTSGSMARASAEGHRVVLVVCTNGEHGESPDDLADGELLVDRRRRETEASAAILGVSRIAWLGYGDSGMTGWDQNADPGSFLQADPDEAAGRLATILGEEHADVVVLYDWHGGYGHPDHAQVHRIGHRAADSAGTPRRFEVTFNRDVLKRWMEAHPEQAPEDFDPEGPADDGNPFGTPEAELHLAVDVAPYIPLKRRALAAHASQVTDIGMFLAFSDEQFRKMFSTEWFIEPGAPPGMRDGWLLDGSNA
jgi:LmbE family N-acetylglucosaminyl deacetylase